MGGVCDCYRLPGDTTSWFALDDELPSAGIGLAVVVVSEKQTPLTYASIGLTNL